MKTEHRLVIDTNLWLSRLLVPDGSAAKTVKRALVWGVPLLSEETQAELVDVLSRSKFDRYISREDRQHFLRLLKGIARTIPITKRIAACRDPKDDKFLDLALNGKAQLILTGDQDLLALHPFRGIAILRPAEFWNRTVTTK